MSDHILKDFTEEFSIISLEPHCSVGLFVFMFSVLLKGPEETLIGFTARCVEGGSDTYLINTTCIDPTKWPKMW